MLERPIASVREIVARRTGEELRLNDRYLNPQMGRILRTLGFDRVWSGRRGRASDRRRRRALPRPVRRLRRVRDRAQPSRGDRRDRAGDGGAHRQPAAARRDAAERRARRAAARARARRASAAMVPANTGTEAVEAAIKIARAATGRPRVLYAEHAFHGLTLGALSLNGNAEFREGFGPLLPGCEPVPFGDLDALERELARGDVAAFVVEPVQGKGVNLPAAAATCRRAAAVPRRPARCSCCDEVQTGIGRTGRFLALRALGAAARHGLPRQGAVRRARADRRGARLARGLRPRVRRHGARGPPRLDVRRQRPRGRRRAGHAARARARRAWSRAPSGWARCCSS